uniref:Tetratricopeptide repeat protein n=1 Tax=Thermomicrobium roseum TaxID=500 RepID=A0A7C2B4N9_THERO
MLSSRSLCVSVTRLALDYVVSLPGYLTTLVGREQEIAEVVDLLQRSETRLVTLTGPGGVGKTRLAVAVAERLRIALEREVVFVELASLRDPALVLTAIAEAMGLQDLGSIPVKERLALTLRDRQLLLLLDNFEHLVSAARDIGALLLAGPQLQILVTSRLPLRLSGERIYHVPPLALPADLDAPTEVVMASPAVQLFLERARASDPAIALTPDITPLAAQICARLDGLPLALELAAARTRLLQLPALLARLERSLQLLTGGARDLPDRQRTLRQTIAWSHDLLDERERILFRRLAAFAGGFTIEAIETVCNFDGRLGSDVLDALMSLLDLSLVQRVPGTEQRPRFRLLETIREFAAEQLVESDEEPLVRHRHATYFLALADRGECALHSIEDRGWLDELEVEHDNYRAVFVWTQAAAPGNRAEAAQLSLRLSLALWWFWVYRGHRSEGYARLTESLTQVHALGILDDRTHAVALLDLGMLDFEQGDYDAAEARLAESARLAGEHGDRHTFCLALQYHGLSALYRGHYTDARALLQESVAVARTLGQPWYVAVTIFALAEATWPIDPQAATVLYQESATVLRSLGACWGLSLPLTSLARQALDEGRYEDARVLCEEGLVLRRAVGHQWWIAMSLCSLGEVARCEGNYALAETYFSEARAIYRTLGRTHNLAWSLRGLGYAVLARGDLFHAHELLREGLMLERELGATPSLAACLSGLAGLAGIGGDPWRAARLFGAAEALLERIGAKLEPADRLDQGRLIAQVSTCLSASAWSEAWQEGRSLPLDLAIAEALAVPAPELASTEPVERPRVHRPRQGLRHGSLTPREQEVARLVARGLSNREIATQLFITEKTVANHIEHIMTKLNLRSRTQIAVWAVQHGLGPEPVA